MNWRAALLVALPAALWLGASAMFQGLDPDFFWHLKVGELALAGSHPEAADPLSWTAAGRYWLDHEWLGERLWAWMLAHGGLGSIRLLHTLLLAALLALVVRLQREEGAELPAATWSALLVGGLLFQWYLPKLQIVSGIGLALTILLLQRWAAGGLRPWMAAGYGAWVVLWANLHGGSAILGPMALSLALAVEAVARRWWPGPRGLRWVAAAAALGWLALLANPAGLGLPVFSLATMLDPRIQQMNAFIVEWKGFDAKSPFYLLYAAWTVAVVAGLALARRVPRPGLLALGLALAAMAYGSYRNIPLAAIATAPAWGAALAGLGRRPALALGAALAVALVVLHPAMHANQFGQLGARSPSPEALQALRRQGGGRKLLNWYAWGGAIGFSCAPAVKVFIDGRQYVFGPQVNEDYMRLATAAPGHEAIVERYKLDAAFFPPNWPILKSLHKDPAWRSAFSDDTAELMLRAPR